MEEALVQLLAETQSSAEAPRKAAEEQLQQLYYDENFPLALCSIASNSSYPSPTRQASLLALKNFVLASWSTSFDEFQGQVLVSDQTKASLRDALFALATSSEAGTERRIQNAASYVVSKIAGADYPDHWPGLLPTLIGLIPQAPDASLHGALKILAELVDEGLSEEQYFQIAQDLVNVLYTVAANTERKPALRALAVSVFKSCFDILEMVMAEHKAAVKGFVEGTVKTWMSLFLDIMKMKLSPPVEDDDQSESGPHATYRGFVALKLQVLKVSKSEMRKNMKTNALTGSYESPRAFPIYTFAAHTATLFCDVGRAFHSVTHIPSSIYRRRTRGPPGRLGWTTIYSRLSRTGKPRFHVRMHKGASSAERVGKPATKPT